MDRIEPSDETLMSAHRQGDREAFGLLVSRHGGRLLGYLRHMSKNREQAEDMFQETFRRVHEKADTFQGRGSFQSWLYVIATHVALDGLRGRKKDREMISLNQNVDCNYDTDTPLVAVLADEKTCHPLPSLVLAEQKRQVQEALEQLPRQQRMTLVLAYYQGLTYREVGEVLGCSLGTVKTHMFRALRTLARRLPDLQGGVE